MTETESEHLEPMALARYLDGPSPDAERSRVEAHLAQCPACRIELTELRTILTRRPHHRWRTLVPLAAAAAALLMVWSIRPGHPTSELLTRDPAMTTTVEPLLLSPMRDVTSLSRFVWSSVPGAERYVIVLYTADGTEAWRYTTVDTVAIPASAATLKPGSYYWQVKAGTAVGRWVDSELRPFSLGGPPASPR